jgi:ActR/RegA family two-component response regulator
VILVVDDDKLRLCRAFRDRGCEAHQVTAAAETIDMARTISPDVGLLDLKMGILNMTVAI